MLIPTPSLKATAPARQPCVRLPDEDAGLCLLYWTRLRHGFLRAVGEDDVNMRIAAFDLVSSAARPRLNALHERPVIDARFEDDQVLDVAGALVLGVADGTFQDRLQQARALIGQELKQLQRLVHGPIAD